MKLPLPRLLAFTCIGIIIMLGSCKGGPGNATTTTTAPATPPVTTSIPPTTTTTATPVPAGCQVVNLILPGDAIPNVYFSIFLVVENSGESPVSCDIPVTFTDRSDEVTTYTINVSLDPGETERVSFDEAILPRDIFTARAGNITNSFQVG